MTIEALAAALLFAADGCALAYIRPRLGRAVAAIIVALAVAGASMPVEPAWRDWLFRGTCAAAAIIAASVHLPRRMAEPLAVGFTTVSAIVPGMAISAAGSSAELAEALPWILLGLPAAALIGSGRQIAVKVVASWLIAISLLSVGVSLVPTPGYKPDHME